MKKRTFSGDRVIVAGALLLNGCVVGGPCRRGPSELPTSDVSLFRERLETCERNYFNLNSECEDVPDPEFKRLAQQAADETDQQLAGELRRIMEVKP